MKTSVCLKYFFYDCGARPLQNAGSWTLKKWTLSQNSLQKLEIQILGADFKYDKSFFNFLPKNTQMRQSRSQI